MKTGALLAEAGAALKAMTRADAAELERHGVPFWASQLLVGIARVSRVAADTALYEPDDDGLWHWITPVCVDDARWPASTCAEAYACLDGIVDLVAWHGDGSWALRAGQAAWLGCVPPQCLDPDPVRIWRSPLHWFRANCTGLVLLSRDAADCRSLLMLFPGGIVAEDQAHRADLRRTLARPWPLPEIFVGPRLQWQVPLAVG